MTLILSPSNMKMWKECPLKYWAFQTKRMVWKDSKAKARGTAVHEAMQKALESGISAVPTWPDKMDVGYTQDTLRYFAQFIEQYKAGGLEVYTEHEMAVNRSLKPTGWWDDDVYLRAKADFVFIQPGQFVHIGDWKTGKIYPDMEFQLQTEALLAHVLYSVPIITWGLYYLDQGQTKTGTIDLRNSIAPVQDVLDTMRDIETMTKAGSFPAQKNRFCRWCDWYQTDNCIASRSW